MIIPLSRGLSENHQGLCGRSRLKQKCSLSLSLRLGTAFFPPPKKTPPRAFIIFTYSIWGKKWKDRIIFRPHSINLRRGRKKGPKLDHREKKSPLMKSAASICLLSAFSRNNFGAKNTDFFSFSDFLHEVLQLTTTSATPISGVCVCVCGKEK